MILTSKIIFTILCSITIAIPSIMDLNKTHMTNPQWTPHARLHWAIQYLATTVIQLLALFLLWGSYVDKDSILITWFAGLAPVLFWGMFFPALIFPGTSTWPDGVEPPKNFPAIFKKMHPNLLLSVVISLLSVIGILLDLQSR